MKHLNANLKALRSEIISELKKFAIKHGTGSKGEREIVFEDFKLSFVQSNTEDMIYSYNSQGLISGDNQADMSFKDLSTDLLLLILTDLNKKRK